MCLTDGLQRVLKRDSFYQEVSSRDRWGKTNIANIRYVPVAYHYPAETDSDHYPAETDSDHCPAETDSDHSPAEKYSGLWSKVVHYIGNRSLV